jgi:hypothetical protein
MRSDYPFKPSFQVAKTPRLPQVWERLLRRDQHELEPTNVRIRLGFVIFQITWRIPGRGETLEFIIALRSDNGLSMTKHELAMAKGSAIVFTETDTLRICPLIFHTF